MKMKKNELLDEIEFENSKLNKIRRNIKIEIIKLEEVNKDLRGKWEELLFGKKCDKDGKWKKNIPSCWLSKLHRYCVSNTIFYYNTEFLNFVCFF